MPQVRAWLADAGFALAEEAEGPWHEGGVRLPPRAGPPGGPSRLRMSVRLRLAVGSGGLRCPRLESRTGRYPAIGSRAVTEDNLALDVRGSPGKTAVRMALSPRLLIRPPWLVAATRDENRVCPAELGSPWCGRARCYAGDFRFRMRSQVQVLAGPPPIPPGHSAVGNQPRTPAASLGRAGAAPPPPPARPSVLPDPPTRAAGPTTTTHRGRPPSPGRQPRGRGGNLTLAPAPVPTARPQATALRTPAWPAWSLSRSSAAARRHPTWPGSATDPLTTATSAASPAPGPARPSIQPLQDAAAHRDLGPFLW
jgi:hypothetical protein